MLTYFFGGKYFVDGTSMGQNINILLYYDYVILFLVVM